MTNYYFSPSELTFVVAALESAYKTAGSWPSDAVAVTDEVFATFAMTTPPEGKKLIAASDGQPAWADVTATTSSSASTASGATATS